MLEIITLPSLREQLYLADDQKKRWKSAVISVIYNNLHIIKDEKYKAQAFNL